MDAGPLNMSFERLGLPKENQLPLDIRESAVAAVGGESIVHDTAIVAKNAEMQVAIKQNLTTKFASEQELLRSKKYYDFLKSFPKFGTFVPTTLYFKGRVKEGDEPSAFCVQPFINGTRIDKISDKELQSDPQLVKELIEFTDAAIDIIRKTREESSIKPDFGNADEPNSIDPRRTSNILIAKEPYEGRRVFFVDTGENAGERTMLAKRLIQRQIIGRQQERLLRDWNAKLRLALPLN